jgi:hypothetical protein
MPDMMPFAMLAPAALTAVGEYVIAAARLRAAFKICSPLKHTSCLLLYTKIGRRRFEVERL